MLAKDLINRLERLGLLDQEIVEALREQLAQSGARVTPEAVAKLLVDNGQLTRFQATKLIGELRSGEQGDAEEATVISDTSGDDLALLDGDDSIVDAIEVVEGDAIEVVEVHEVDSSGSNVPTGTPSYVPMAGSVTNERSMDEHDSMLPLRPRNVKTVKKPGDPSRSVWDSFKIYGIASIILVLCFFSGLLWFVINKGSADEFIGAANDQYNQQSYAAAQASFDSFLEKFGESNPHSSIARTRSAMCKLYLAAQMTKPEQVIDDAERMLPLLEGEAGLDEERNNLAALLVDIADNIAKTAVSAKSTEEKQQLLVQLDRQIKLTDNPTYVTSTTRQALSSRLLNVAETRAIVRRDINRNLRLDESVVSMEASLAAKDTKKAYDTRFELLREYPELHDNERLVKLIQSASGIQMELVKDASERPTVSNEPIAGDSVKSIVLTNKTGDAAPGLRDEVAYVRVHGSILAFNAADGRLLWRRFVGTGQDYSPLPIDPTGRDGALLCDSQLLEVQRASGQDGAIQWRAKVGEAFSQPVAQGGEIFMSTKSGRLVSLDAETGEPRWVTQLPQPLEQSPGVSDRPANLYLTGDHSNLYVLDRRAGKCSESFYIGHAKGTVAVPPITLHGPDSGHVFVIENRGVDYALMHILKCDAEGRALVVAQPPQRLDGNVIVPPVIVQGRRLIVLTDRGQVAVFDIEQTAAAAEQVSKVAEQVASYDTPVSTQMAVGKSQMWVTGTRIGRYELQVSTGRVPRDWIMHEGDSFISKPFLIEDTLIHARVLRGTSGVRVTGADPQTGKAYWQTDVGVPVAMLTPKADAKGFHAITTQASLFELDAQSLADGTTSGPIENPGGSGAAMRFEDPLRIDDQRVVMMNQETSGQICVYDPTREREKIRLMTLAISAGKSGGPGIIVGDGLFLPLDTGRIVLMNWQTGGPLGSPFQPASEPDKSVLWSRPVVLGSDASQVVVADDRKKLYRLRVAEQIRELAVVDLVEPLLGPMVNLAESIIATSSGPSADFLLVFDSTSLEEKARTLLDGRITWGPLVSGDIALLQTDDKMLRGFDAAGKPAMTPVALPSGDVVPSVRTVRNTVILAGRSGWIAAIDRTTGTMTGMTNLGEPISAAPLDVGKRLLVPGTEGLVFITAIPETVEK